MSRRKLSLNLNPSAIPMLRMSPSCSPAPVTDGGWPEILERAESLLPPGLRIYLGDVSVITGVLDGDSLRLSVAPGFIYGLFNTQNVLLSFRQAAGDVLGKPVAVTIAEMREDMTPAAHSIDELKNSRKYILQEETNMSKADSAADIPAAATRWI